MFTTVYIYRVYSNAVYSDLQFGLRACFHVVGLLLGLLLEHTPQDLPGNTLRDLIDEPDASAQLLVVRDLAVQPLADIRSLLLRAGARGLALGAADNEGKGNFSAVGLALDTDHSNVIDSLVVDKDTLQLGRRNLEALVFDKLLDTVRDIEAAVLILISDISGAEPSIRRETVRRGGLVVMVAQEDVGATQVQLAGLADLDFLRLGAVLGHAHVFGFHVGQQFTDGANAGLPLIPGLGVGGRASFAQAIALLDTNLDAIIHAFHQLLGKRCSAGVHHPQARQVILVDDWVLAKQQHDRGDDVAEGDAIVLHMSAPFLDVELLHDDQLVASVEGCVEETGQSVDMVERQEGQDAISLAVCTAVPRQIGLTGTQLENIRNDIPMRKHDTLRNARCTGGEDKEGQILGRIDLGSAEPRHTGNIPDRGEMLDPGVRVALISEQEYAILRYPYPLRGFLRDWQH